MSAFGRAALKIEPSRASSWRSAWKKCAERSPAARVAHPGVVAGSLGGGRALPVPALRRRDELPRGWLARVGAAPRRAVDGRVLEHVVDDAVTGRRAAASSAPGGRLAHERGRCRCADLASTREHGDRGDERNDAVAPRRHLPDRRAEPADSVIAGESHPEVLEHAPDDRSDVTARVRWNAPAANTLAPPGVS